MPVELAHFANSVALRPLVFKIVEVVPPLPINLADAGMFALALWLERKENVERKSVRVKHRTNARVNFLLGILSSC
jgi:hypothetical protein